MSVTERLGGFLLAKSSRRSFIAKSAMTATALSVAPVDFLLHPVSAYASVCSCAELELRLLLALLRRVYAVLLHDQQWGQRLPSRHFRGRLVEGGRFGLLLGTPVLHRLHGRV